MARIETDPNYTAPTFSRATAAADIFKKEDVQNLAAAMSAHDHAPGKGLPVAALAANVAVGSGTVLNGNLGVGGTLVIVGAAGFQALAQFNSDVAIAGGQTPATILRNTATFLDIYNDGGIRVVNQIGTAAYFEVDSAGSHAYGALVADGSVRARADLYVGPEAGPAIRLSISGTNPAASSILDVSGQLRVSGDRVVLNPDVVLQRAAAAQLQITSRVGINVAPQGTYALSLPNLPPAGGDGNVIASRFDVYSSERYKTAITPIEDALQMVRDDRVHGVRYRSTLPAPSQETQAETPLSVGFVAEQWAVVEPAVVALDQHGLPVSMSYADVGAITFEALKQYAAATDARLAALEAA